ncbi:MULTISPECIES: MlaD family protein [Pontibacter]|uniref:Phospholipid/cholesterol/gamma-HCH transport system substrate-binding protein n=1 Tax=Pontibacter lucknowensis TaxID=1077936 RepID=A0A1N6TEK9_9BACT|nr:MULTISPECIES: MlaD family protein [Pontibacter]EJF09499.1 mammalian cell entry domain-containing protein [Pontibacter sp. BAB1700]SIQ51687.1 phospholipid/cholesterol/gamma-HCH transport system substrate-binding protein [Pontibacter lucknowensis]
MKLSKEIKVALLGIVAILILYFGYDFLKGSSIFSKSNTFHVVYDNVDGLTASNPVILNGIQVGQVKEMTLLTDRGNMVRVDIEVRKDLQIGDSTIASLGNSDLLGSKAITLHLRNSTKMFDGGEELIAFKETSIADMISSKSVPVIDKVDTTLARVNRLLDSEAKGNIQQILANSNKTTEMINDILRENQRNINQITGNLSQLTSALKQTQKNIDRLALNMTEITDTLKQVEIKKLVRDANSAVNELETTIAKLNSNQGSLGRLMNDEELYQNMNRSTEALNLLLRDIQAYPKRYVQFSLIGRKDRYKVDATGRVITLEEVKEMQDANPDEFRRPAPDTVKVAPADTTKRQ